MTAAPARPTPRKPLPVKGSKVIPGKIVVVVNTKGGVGKSTVATHLAWGMAKAGHRVRLVDADMQGSSSRWVTEAKAGLDVVRLETANDILERIRPLTFDGSIVVADGPGGMSETSRALLLVADVALLPCGPSKVDLESLTETVRVLDQAKAIRNGLPTGALIPNRLQARTRLSAELAKVLAGFGLPVLPGLTLRQAYPEAAGQRTLVSELPGEGAAAAALEMKALLKAVAKLIA